jgi:DNA invertase Pin-like site-specific DNA recombinase
MEDACAARGWHDVEIVEEVKSGGRADNRPELQALLRRLKTGDALVVSKLDRLSRSTGDFGELVELARRKGWSLVVLDLGLDLSTPMAGMVAVFAQLERRMIAQRTREALARSARQDRSPMSSRRRSRRPRRARPSARIRRALAARGRRADDRGDRPNVASLGRFAHPGCGSLRWALGQNRCSSRRLSVRPTATARWHCARRTRGRRPTFPRLRPAGLAELMEERGVRGWTCSPSSSDPSGRLRSAGIFASGWVGLALAGGSVPLGRAVVRTDIGEQRHLPRSFDRDRDEALVSATGAGHPARPDLSSLGEVAAKLGDVLVVNVAQVVLAEQTRLPLEHARTGACPCRRRRRVSALASFRSCRHGLSLRNQSGREPVRTPDGASAPSLQTASPL